MAWMVRRLRSATGPMILTSGIILAGLSMVGVSRADDLVLPFGVWNVEARGFAWPCRLESLEIRPSNHPGEALLVGSKRGDDGQLRLWGTSRIDRKATGPMASRWFTAAWPSGTSTVLIQLRPEPAGRLIALIREQSKDRVVGDRVRQVVLAPIPADERPVIDGPARHVRLRDQP